MSIQEDVFSLLEETFGGIHKVVPKRYGELKSLARYLQSCWAAVRNASREDSTQGKRRGKDILAGVSNIPDDGYLPQKARTRQYLASVSSISNSDKHILVLVPAKQAHVGRRRQALDSLMQEALDDQRIGLHLFGCIVRLLSLIRESDWGIGLARVAEQGYHTLVILGVLGILFHPSSQKHLKAVLLAHEGPEWRYDEDLDVFDNLLHFEAYLGYKADLPLSRCSFYGILLCATIQALYTSPQSGEEEFVQSKAHLFCFTLSRLCTIQLVLEGCIPAPRDIHSALNGKLGVDETCIGEYALNYLRPLRSILKAPLDTPEITTLTPRQLEVLAVLLKTRSVLTLDRFTAFFDDEGDKHLILSRSILLHLSTVQGLHSYITNTIMRALLLSFGLRYDHLINQKPQPMIHAPMRGENGEALVLTVEEYVFMILLEFQGILAHHPVPLLWYANNFYVLSKAIATVDRTDLLTFRNVYLLLHASRLLVASGLIKNHPLLYHYGLQFFRQSLPFILLRPAFFGPVSGIIRHLIYVPLCESQTPEVRVRAMLCIDGLFGSKSRFTSISYTETQMNLYGLIFGDGNSETLHESIIVDLLRGVISNLHNHTEVSVAGVEQLSLSAEYLICFYRNLGDYAKLPGQTKTSMRTKLVPFSKVSDCAVYVLTSVLRGLHTLFMSPTLTLKQRDIILSHPTLRNYLVTLLDKYRLDVLSRAFDAASDPSGVVEELISCGYISDASSSLISFIETQGLSKRGIGALLGRLGSEAFLEDFTAHVFEKIRRRLEESDQPQHGQSEVEETSSTNLSEPFVICKENVFLSTLRTYLESFHIPGEAQQIERILHCFSAHFLPFFVSLPDEYKSGTTFTQELAFVLSYAVMMLNTDIHNSSVKRKMTRDEFVNNTKAADKQNLIRQEFLQKIYDDISKNPFSLTELRLKQLLRSEGFDTAFSNVSREISGKLNKAYANGLETRELASLGEYECIGLVFEEEAKDPPVELLIESNESLEETNLNATMTINEAPSVLEDSIVTELSEDDDLTQHSPVAAPSTQDSTVHLVPFSDIAATLQKEVFRSPTQPLMLMIRRKPFEEACEELDPEAFKQYEHFLRLSITLNLFIGEAVQGVASYLQALCTTPLRRSSLVSELVFHLYRLCDYILVCQTKPMAGQEHVTTIISKEGTSGLIARHRSTLLRALSLSSMFVLRKYLWPLNLLLLRIVPSEVRVRLLSGLRANDNKEALATHAHIAAREAIMCFYLFGLVSHRVNPNAYEAFTPLFSVSKTVYVMLQGSASKVLKYGIFVLSPDSQFSINDLCTQTLLTGYLDIFAHQFVVAARMLQKADVKFEFFSKNLFLDCTDLQPLYRNAVDIGLLNLISPERITQLVLHCGDLHQYGIIRVPINLVYINTLFTVFRQRARDYRSGSVTGSMTNLLQRPFLSIHMDDTDQLEGTGDGLTYERFLADVSTLYSSLLALCLYSYSYALTERELAQVTSGILDYVRELLTLTGPVLKHFGVDPETRMKTLILPLAHMSKLVPHPATLRDVLDIVLTLAQASEECSEYQCIFSVLLASVYRLSNKGQTSCLGNARHTLTCDQCYHSPDHCVFSLDFLLVPPNPPSTPTLGTSTASGSDISGNARKRGSPQKALFIPDARYSLADALAASSMYSNNYDWSITYDRFTTVLDVLRTRIPSLTENTVDLFADALAELVCLGDSPISKTALDILSDMVGSLVNLDPQHLGHIFELYAKILHGSCDSVSRAAYSQLLEGLKIGLTTRKYTDDLLFWSRVYQSCLRPIVLLQYGQKKYVTKILIADLFVRMLSPEPAKLLGSDTHILDLTPEELLDAKKVFLSTPPTSNDIFILFFEMVTDIMKARIPSAGDVSILYSKVICPLLLTYQAIPEAAGRIDLISTPLLSLVNAWVETIPFRPGTQTLCILPLLTLLEQLVPTILELEAGPLRLTLFTGVLQKALPRMLERLQQVALCRNNVVDSPEYLVIEDAIRYAFQVSELMFGAAVLSPGHPASSLALDGSDPAYEAFTEVLQQAHLLLETMGTSPSVQASDRARVGCDSLVIDLIGLLTRLLNQGPETREICRYLFRQTVIFATHKSAAARRALVLYLQECDTALLPPIKRKTEDC
ncbi:Sec7 family protein [Giardia muris]|uniref:Sec7 family protein n=1 Tax=Giardia muris TaxID=5742 RepID=A0A4Z1T055_GIAMU|nr:Sec7 family protein [Giardia muris]|eukprot:TNJ26287.1 Sec7 family protein [Giardia muris]